MQFLDIRFIGGNQIMNKENKENLSKYTTHLIFSTSKKIVEIV